jgi:hypothetical protein
MMGGAENTPLAPLKGGILRNSPLKWGIGWGLVLVFCLFAKTSSSFAQNYNPPFPRLGVIYFYEVRVPEEIWKHHDLIVSRFWYPEIARKIKARYPNKIVLAANNIIDGTSLRPSDQWLVPTLNDSCLFGWHPNSHPGDCFYDPTDLCPPVNGVRWNEYVTRHLARETDWTVFDGTFWDSWADGIMYQPHYNQVDFNRNGIADNKERRDLANEYWQEGNRLIVEKLRQYSPPGKVVMAHETGMKEYEFLNGRGFEYWKGFHWQWVFESLLLPYAKESLAPRVNFLEGQGETESYERMRFGLATACLADAYFGFEQQGSFHEYTYLYDEFLADLGYPTSEAQQIDPGVWVRYFDKGLVIANGSGAPQTVSASDLEGGPYYRFRGGQQPAFNNGQQFTSVVLAGSGAPDKLHEQTGDGILLFKQPTTLVMEIVVDNVERNMTSPGSRPVTLRGAWTQQELSKAEGNNGYCLAYGWGDYGKPYAYVAGGMGESQAVYAPTIGVPGEYEVFEWHPFHGSSDADAQEAADVPYVIVHGKGTTTGTIDQSQRQGQWNSLGKFNFETGGGGSVTLSNKVSSGYVLADAIKFVHASASNPNEPQPDTTPPAPPTGVKVQ